MSPSVAITGATGGIGQACVQYMSEQGRHVIAMGRNQAALKGLEASGHRAMGLDVTDAGAVESAFARVGPLDGLVVNAGVCAAEPIDGQHALAVWRDVLSVNLDGAFNTLRAAAKRLVAGASVVVVSSGLGKVGRPGYSAYCASKHAVLGLTKALALEWAPRDITVNAVCPGWVETPMAQADLSRGGAPQQARLAAEAAIPIGRFVRPAEVAALIGWLLSPQARAITGQSYAITGGEVS